MPKIAFINKMDRVGADYFYCVDSMKEKLGAHAVPSSARLVLRETSWGWSTWSHMKAYLFKDETMGAEYDVAEIPADLKEKCQEMRQHLLEGSAMLEGLDESFVNQVLEDPDALSENEIHAAIRFGVCANAIHPVLCGTAFKNKGVQPLGCHYGVASFACRSWDLTGDGP